VARRNDLLHVFRSLQNRRDDVKKCYANDVRILASFPCSTIRADVCKLAGQCLNSCYENEERDNHERLPDVRTMSSARFWIGANDNKTGPRATLPRDRPLSIRCFSDSAGEPRDSRYHAQWSFRRRDLYRSSNCFMSRAFMYLALGRIRHFMSINQVHVSL
jgi:hypothetical protein